MVFDKKAIKTSITVYPDFISGQYLAFSYKVFITMVR